MIKEYERMALDMLYTREEAVIRFFVVMSRFEFAVKKKGYTKNGSSLPDWDRYVACLSETYGDIPIGHDCFSAAVEYLHKEPPNKLDKDMQWKPWGSDRTGTNLAKAFLSIKQVRNNLFHGYKGADKSRNDELIGASLVVLEALLERDEKLRELFYPTSH